MKICYGTIEWYTQRAEYHHTMMLHYLFNAIWKENQNQKFGKRYHWRAEIHKFNESAIDYFRALHEIEKMRSQ